MAGTQTKSLTVEISRELFTRLKQEAVRRDVPLKRLVELFLDAAMRSKGRFVAFKGREREIASAAVSSPLSVSLE